MEKMLRMEFADPMLKMEFTENMLASEVTDAKDSALSILEMANPLRIEKQLKAE